MSTYKLIQDIEAEDHILGPLTFRQFIFALIAAFLYYVCFIIVVKFHAWVLLALFVPPALFFTFFALPWGGDQPTEIWALAKLHFLFTPRRRIWNQSGVKELVTITVPKKVERVYTDGLSQAEVKSRLQALANTLDSRGWAIKHVNAIGYASPQVAAVNSDRLLGVTEAPQEVPNYTPAEDVLDTDNNPVAQQFESMIDKSTREYRERLMAQMRSPLPAAGTAAQGGSGPSDPSDPSDQWFMNHSPVAGTPITPAPAAPVAAVAVTDAGDAGDEGGALSTQLKNQVSNAATGNLRTLQPAASGADSAAPNDTSGAVTTSGDPAILSLSKNDDLNVATIARQAQKAKNGGGAQDEVVISLH